MIRKGVDKLNVKALLLLIFSTASITATAQEEGRTGLFSSIGLEEVLIALMVFMIGGVVVLLINIKSLIDHIKRTRLNEEQAAAVEQTGFWQALTDSVPVEREDEVKTDHEYDGIVELDNNLPPWWLAGFYITIAISVVYIFYYHVYYDGNTSEREFLAEMEAAETRKTEAPEEEKVDEENLELLTAQEELEAGKKVYMRNCAACHSGDGSGGVGPNLTDEYWIHGGSLKDIYEVIKQGVPSKGMIAWKDQLPPKDMHRVASYVYKMRENPADGKEPEGEKYVPDDDSGNDDSESETEEQTAKL